jgi:hypothetical protein
MMLRNAVWYYKIVTKRRIRTMPLTFQRFSSGRKAIVTQSSRSKIALIFFHGAGLEPTADLYTSFAEALPEHVKCICPFTSASHFLAFQNDFRRTAGWTCHDPDTLTKEAASWVAEIQHEADHIVVGGHSWGAYLAATVGHEGSLFLVSPIPQLRSIVESNVDPTAETDAEWIRCRKGAPFPFISRSTVTGLSSARRQLSDILVDPAKPVCVVYGSKEHPLISAWADELPPHPLRTLHRIAGAGHFYGGRGSSLATPFLDWLQSI